MITLQALLTGFRFSTGVAPSVNRSILAEIREGERRLAGLDDDQLRAESLKLRDRTVDAFDGTVDAAAAFALVSESAQRALGIRFYDVQLLAGLSLLRNEIAEMKTGEGKTFVGAIVSYAQALHGHGVHFMTTNDYLAKRDYEIVRPLFERLGLTVGLVERESSPDEKRDAYLCDVTYGPGYEFGFDYLRDQLAMIQKKTPELGESFISLRRGDRQASVPRTQRQHFCAIIDEADSVLIDEATTPLVLSGSSGQASKNPQPYLLAHDVASALTIDKHFTTDSSTRVATLTKGGLQEILGRLEPSARNQLRRPWFLYVQQALQAQHHFTRDAEYVVSENKIKIVDANTGRLFEDRTWSNGLHQAVEAKEGVPITEENNPLAGISRQQYFRLYENLCGMTGTAIDSKAELRNVYQLNVTVIPTHKPCIRTVHPSRFFAGEDAKWEAIAESVSRIHEIGQPVLIGTRTIDKSEQIAARLRGLDFQLLNGKQDADEAHMIAGAGKIGAIMIATNMAGRGTDIKLGQGVAKLGGIHVIVSEPHDSARVDRQLIGRASRQGDPGSCQTFVSAEDNLIVQHAPWMARYIRKLAGTNQEVAADLSREIAKLQKSVERKSAAKRREMFGSESWQEEVMSTLAKKSIS